MDHVFILYSVDQNDETTIISVFSNYESANLCRANLDGSPDLRKSYSLSVSDRLFIDSYVVYD